MGFLKRQEMKGRAKSRIGEVRGQLSYGDPDSWNDDLNEATDETARRTWCYYVAENADLTSGTADYPLPAQIFRIKEVIVKDAAGNIFHCSGRTRRDMDALYGASWRENPATGTPTYYILGGGSGTEQISFYPVPDYTTTSNTGFTVEGYAVPANSWSNETDVCPLPDRAEQVVISLAALKRACRFPNDYKEHIPILSAEVTQKMGLLEAETLSLSEATQATGRITRRFSGGWF